MVAINWSFGTRLKAGTAAIILLIVLMGAWAAYRTGTQHRELALLRTQNVASVASVHVSSIFDKTDATLKSLAYLYDTSLLSRGANEQSVRRLIEQELKHRPELENLYFAGIDGTLWPRAPGDPLVNVADREHFRATRSGDPNALNFSEPVVGRVHGSTMLVMTRRINNPDGSHAGMIAAALPTDRISEAFAHFDLGDNMLVALRTAKFASVARAVGSTANRLAGVNPALPDSLIAAITANPQRGNTLSVSNTDRIERLVAYQRLERHPFYVVVGMPTADINRAVTKDVAGIAALGVLAILITLAAALMLQRVWRRRSAALAAAERERERTAMLLNNASDGIHITNAEGKLLEASDSFCAMLGRTREELLGMHVWEWDDRWTREEILAGMQLHVRENLARTFETVHRQKDGRRFDVEINSKPITYEGELVLFCSAREISERKAVERALKVSDTRLRLAAEAGEVGIFDIDTTSKLAWRSPGHARIFGYDSNTDAWGLSQLLAHVVEEDRNLVRDAIHAASVAEVPFGMEFRIVRNDSQVRWISVKADPLRESPGAPLHLVGTSIDITERKLAEMELRRVNELLRTQALRDPLTGLFNRRYADETLPRELSKAGRGGYPVSVIMLDIDFFKPVNDTHGHPAGDEVLRALGTLLAANVRGGDVACRYGGEEFLLVLPNAGALWAQQRAEQIRLLVAGLRVDIQGTQIAITVSAGVATFPDTAGTATLLLAKADAALYAAKHAGRDRVEVAVTAQHTGSPG